MSRSIYNCKFGIHLIIVPNKFVDVHCAMSLCRPRYRDNAREIDVIMQISPIEILPALNEVFTLDTFTISYVSVAIRSFVHHFYPAYGPPITELADNLMKKTDR